MDTLSSDGGLVEHDPTRPENNFGPSDYDRTHRLTTSFMRRRCPASAARARSLGAVTGDWNIAGHLHLPVGHAVLGHRQPDAKRLLRAGRAAARELRARADGRRCGELRAASRIASTTTSTSRPSSDSLDQWGDTGRNILRGPSQAQVDLTLARTLPLQRGRRLELRWEIYNALNTPVFANPASTFAANGCGTAGRITSTIGGPRTMQLAARFLF